METDASKLGELNQNPDTNELLNLELERFNSGTAFGTLARTREQMSVNFYWPHCIVTSISEIDTGREVRLVQFVEPHTHAQLFWVFGRDAPESIKDKIYKKQGAQTPLVEVDIPSFREPASVDPVKDYYETLESLESFFKPNNIDEVEATADDEEVLALTGLIKRFNDRYEKLEISDLRRETKARFESVIEELCRPDVQHPMVQYEDHSKYGVETTVISDHGVHVILKKRRKKDKLYSYAAEFYGERVPQELRKKMLRFGSPEATPPTVAPGLIAVFNVRTSDDKARNFMYYPKQPDQPEQTGEGNEPEDEHELYDPVDVLRETTAIQVIELLERYADGCEWQVDPNHKDITPPTANMLRTTQARLETILDHKDGGPWKVLRDGSGGYRAQLVVGSTPLTEANLVVDIKRFARDIYEIGVYGSQGPDSLRGLMLTLNFTSGKYEVGVLNPADAVGQYSYFVLHPVKALIGRIKGEIGNSRDWFTPRWRESYQQIEDLIELLQP